MYSTNLADSLTGGRNYWLSILSPVSWSASLRLGTAIQETARRPWRAKYLSHVNHTVKILRINIFLKHDTLCPPKLLLDCVVIRSYKDNLLKSQFQLEKTAGSKRFDPDHGWNHESNATTIFKKRSSAIEPASRGRNLPARRVHFSSLSLETEHLANKLFTGIFFFRIRDGIASGVPSNPDGPDLAFRSGVIVSTKLRTAYFSSLLP